jgi:hypothetical protein
MGKKMQVFLVLTFLTAIVPLGTTQADAKSYSNCNQLRRLYPSGVAKSRASAGDSGAKVSSNLYRQNRKLDADNDGIACEPSGPSANPSYWRLGDLCVSKMLSPFVNIQVRLMGRNKELDPYITGVGVVTDRKVDNSWRKPKSDAYSAEGIQIEVLNICGKTGGQNSPRPTSTPGTRTYIYSYGGDAMVIGDVQLNDVVIYANPDMSYSFGLYARPVDGTQVYSAASNYRG